MSIMSIIGSILSIFDKIAGKIPIQNRTERWKNELDKLQRELKGLLNEDASLKKASRVAAIVKRIDELNGLLKNNANSN